MLMLLCFCSDVKTFCYLVREQHTECHEQADVKAVSRPFPTLELGLTCETIINVYNAHTKFLYETLLYGGTREWADATPISFEMEYYTI